MDNVENIFLGMEKILDQLVDTAEKLKEASSRSVTENELDVLQKKQEKLLKELAEFDQKHKLSEKGHIPNAPEEITKRIEEKLHQFQALNAAFIENLNTNHGLIKFDAEKKKRSPFA